MNLDASQLNMFWNCDVTMIYKRIHLYANLFKRVDIYIYITLDIFYLKKCNELHNISRRFTVLHVN